MFTMKSSGDGREDGYNREVRVLKGIFIWAAVMIIMVIIAFCVKGYKNKKGLQTEEVVITKAINLKGHDYILVKYEDESYIVHSPECKKCYEIYD